MKRLRNWNKLVPTAEQIRASKRWQNFAEEAKERSYMFFCLAHETFDIDLKIGLMTSSRRLGEIHGYCCARADQSLIIDQK